MKTGILDSGIVGQVLAKAFAGEGHDVMLGTRNTSKEEVVKFKNENPGIRTGTFAETAAFGELLVLAVAGSGAEEAISLADTDNFKNKVVIDTTNPIAAAPPVNGVLKFFTTPDESLMERIQKAISEAKVVKAFNSVGNALMYKPHFKDGKPTMFICGNDNEAKKEVTDILTAFGWETEDMGKVEAARAIEPLCILWCIPGFIRNQWTHAFKLLKL
ncbi:MAG TPA: NAD(P)-binding domain-containing protein [Chitinophagaceae bacterium]|nr:NAD(P)-binding domain-containing protein [Chitinophagaceae bacterium]